MHRFFEIRLIAILFSPNERVAQNTSEIRCVDSSYDVKSTVGAFYWKDRCPDILNNWQEEQVSFLM